MSRRATGERLAVAYIRVSTDDQRLGPVAQRDAITLWALKHDLVISSWHEDLGISGGCDAVERKGLREALAAVRVLRAASLLVAKRDRLARDVLVAASVEREVARLGARLISADGAGNGDSPADAFMRTVIDGAAEYERSLIRSRTKAALRAKRGRGERVGQVPFGYALAADRVKLEPKASEQGIIRRVCELRALGLSLRAIVECCERELLVSRSGRPLQKTQVERILATGART